jgi:hypothetical protein
MSHQGSKVTLCEFASKRAKGVIRVSRKILRELAGLGRGSPTWAVWAEDKASGS